MKPVNLNRVETKVKQLSLKDFINIPDCPRQRDTEKHAQKALREHLRAPSPTHLSVSIAELPNGSRYKLDGHTRAHLWKTGSLKSLGDHVTATIYMVSNIHQVNELYVHFDASTAAENAGDQIAGAFRENKWAPASPYLRAGAISQALALADSAIFNGGKGLERKYAGGVASAARRRELVSFFLNDLKEIDRLHVSYPGGARNNRVNGGIVAAMIATHRAASSGRCGDLSIFHRFWAAYLNDEGVKNGRVRDAVQALAEYSSSGTQFADYMDVCHKAVSAFYGYCKKKTYTVTIRDCNLELFREQRAA